MKVFPMLLVFASAVFVSCERHDWAETKKMHEPHGAHAHHGDHGHGGGDAHGHEKDAKGAGDHGHGHGTDEHKH